MRSLQNMVNIYLWNNLSITKIAENNKTMKENRQKKQIGIEWRRKSEAWWISSKKKKESERKTDTEKRKKTWIYRHIIKLTALSTHRQQQTSLILTNKDEIKPVKFAPNVQTWQRNLLVNIYAVIEVHTARAYKLVIPNDKNVRAPGPGSVVVC